MSSSIRLSLPVFLFVIVMLCCGGFLVACAQSPVAVPQTNTAPAQTPQQGIATPTPDSAPTTDSLARMQALLESGVADGRVEQGGEVLLQTWERVEQALGTRTRQNTNAAKQQLLLMQLQIVQGIGSKTIDAEFGQVVLAHIDSIAREYDLQLPQMFARPRT